MQRVLRCSFLVIICCISWTDSHVITATLIREIGDDILIECATDKTPQDGVYMYKQGAANKQQEIFFFYKTNHLTYKTMNESKIRVSGVLLNLTVTLLKATAEDTGLYWCEFNLEEKTTVGRFTWLWMEKSEEENKECPEEVLPYAKNLLILFAVISLLCIIGFFCVILKMKGCWGNRKYTPSNPASDL